LRTGTIAETDGVTCSRMPCLAPDCCRWSACQKPAAAGAQLRVRAVAR
jgi:hypothetical protein